MSAHAYRVTLVWILRVGAIVATLSSVGTMALTIRDAGLNPVASTSYALAQLVLNCVLYLAVAEVLALLVAKKSKQD
jgi:hypothetical protein